MSSRWLRHTERIYSWIPFVFYNKPTAMYRLDRIRYAKYFSPTMDLGGRPVEETAFKTKWSLQQTYQAEMEAQGKILKAIFIEKEAGISSTACDYLLWLDWQWTLYQNALNDKEYSDEGFVRFVQSDLTDATELTETWKIK